MRIYRKDSRSSWVTRVVGIVLFAFVFISLVLLVLSRIDNSTVQSLRGRMADLLSPVFEVAAVPAGYVRRSFQRISTYSDTFEEMDRLSQENQRLKQWEWRAKQLERKIAQLRSLLNAVEEPALRFATGRVIADGRGPFAHSVLVNIGRKHGVKNGFAVVNSLGLVGRTVDTGDGITRILLLTDFNSRVPVEIGRQGVRGVLVGDNSLQPRLDFLPSGAKVYDGEVVYTSGHGGLLPRGLRVGVVRKGPKGARINTYVQFNALDYVSTLFFTSPGVAAANKDDIVSGRVPVLPKSRLAAQPTGGEAGENSGRPR